MKSIGGYFGLELPEKEAFHKEAIALNTGRCALECVLTTNNYTKIYLPYYSCEALLEPILKLNIPHEFYPINTRLEPEFNYERILESEVFLYINYFGIKDPFISTLHQITPNLIIDNVQSFFSLPIPQVNTFYSARKFFGVPDGAYLYSAVTTNPAFEVDSSADRMQHLLMRIDKSAEEGYSLFQKNEVRLQHLPIRLMSELSKKLLASIDYDAVAEKRKLNFQYLHERLSAHNKLSIDWDGNQVPMNYPFWSDNNNLRDLLFSHKIYCPVYWPNVLLQKGFYTLEKNLANQLICLPVDQRYTQTDMDYIINLILHI
ncbi:MAG: hypothetical protein V4590_09425 [Bacteroidota bacterium]